MPKIKVVKSLRPELFSAIHNDDGNLVKELLKPEDMLEKIMCMQTAIHLRKKNVLLGIMNKTHIDTNFMFIKSIKRENIPEIDFIRETFNIHKMNVLIVGFSYGPCNLLAEYYGLYDLVDETNKELKELGRNEIKIISDNAHETYLNVIRTFICLYRNDHEYADIMVKRFNIDQRSIMRDEFLDIYKLILKHYGWLFTKSDFHYPISHSQTKFLKQYVTRFSYEYKKILLECSIMRIESFKIMYNNCPESIQKKAVKKIITKFNKPCLLYLASIGHVNYTELPKSMMAFLLDSGINDEYIDCIKYVSYLRGDIDYNLLKLPDNDREAISRVLNFKKRNNIKNISFGNAFQDIQVIIPEEINMPITPIVP